VNPFKIKEHEKELDEEVVECRRISKFKDTRVEELVKEINEFEQKHPVNPSLEELLQKELRKNEMKKDSYTKLADDVYRIGSILVWIDFNVASGQLEMIYVDESQEGFSKGSLYQVLQVIQNR